MRPSELKAKIQAVENGGVYAKRGVTNFLEGDFFGWYVDALSKRLVEAIQDIALALADFEPGTPRSPPRGPARPSQRSSISTLFRRRCGHDLGEYYTPDWLAELTLKRAGYDGNTLKRFLDPACGSGTFLALAIQRPDKYGLDHGEPPRETAKHILANIWGFDLNPWLCIAARTNYLFALGDLLTEVETRRSPSTSPTRSSGRNAREHSLRKTTCSCPPWLKDFHVPAYG